MLDKTKYIYNDVILTPFYTPVAHFNIPSLIGSSSLHIQAIHHFFDSKTINCSRPIHILKPEKYIDFPCIYGGFLFSHFGHFIRESLSRIYYIKQHNLTYPIVFSYSPINRLIKFQKQIFELLNIYNEIIIIDDITMFRTLHCPLPGSLLGMSYLDVQREALQIVQSKKIEGKKIYISRSNIKNRSFDDELDFEDILIKRGWGIIHPEKMPIKDQLNEYASADKIMTTFGSALYGMLFIKNMNQKLYILPRCKTNEYNILLDALKTSCKIIDIKKENIRGLGNDFSKQYNLDIKALLNLLEETNDFSRCDSAKILKSPEKPSESYTCLPDICLEQEEKPEIANSLFWLILYANKTGKRVKGAKRAIYILLKNNLLQPYMMPQCFEFINNHTQEFLLAFIRYLKRLHFPNLIKYIEFSSKMESYNDSFDPFSPYIRPSYSNKDVHIAFETHLSNLGWIGASPEGWVNGDPTGKNKIEALRCTTNNKEINLTYGVMFKNSEWHYSLNNEVAGTTGQCKPIHGIVLKLDDHTGKYHLKYRVRLKKGRWSQWFKNGTYLGFPNTSISAIQIDLKNTN